MEHVYSVARVVRWKNQITVYNDVYCNNELMVAAVGNDMLNTIMERIATENNAIVS